MFYFGLKMSETILDIVCLIKQSETTEIKLINMMRETVAVMYTRRNKIIMKASYTDYAN